MTTQNVNLFRVTISGQGTAIDVEVDSEAALKIIAITLGADAAPDVTTAPRTKSAAPKKSTPKKEAGQRKSARPGSLGIVKSMTLRPAGKVSFEDFVKSKSPSGHKQRQVTAVYWLAQEAGIESITAEHINTCYREIGWERPKDLVISLRLTASKKGWLDTSDQNAITLTNLGEDFVEHKLPADDGK